MTAKKRLIAFLDKGEKKAVEFIESIQRIFNEHDESIRLFGKPFHGKFESDYSYLQSEIIEKYMGRMIENSKSGEQLIGFTYKDQQQILKVIDDFKLEEKRAYLQEIMKQANYHPQRIFVK